MRLRRHILLTERNITNVKDVEAFLKGIASTKRASAEEARWLMTTFRKWLINDYVDDIMIITEPRQGSPAWVQKALDRNEQVYSVMLTSDLRTKVEHILDWLRSDMAPRRLNRLSVPQAQAGAARWDAVMRKKAAGIKDQGQTEHVAHLKAGATLVKLLDKAACKWEGKQMSHCVGNYDPADYSGPDGIYSIRDKSGDPHVTIEVRSRCIVQAHGHGDRPPVRKYFDVVKDALERRPLSAFSITDHQISTIGGVIDSSGKIWHVEELPGGLTFRNLKISEFGPFVLPKDTKVTGTLSVGRGTEVEIGRCDIKSLDISTSSSVSIDGATIEHLSTGKADRIRVTNSKIERVALGVFKSVSLKESVLGDVSALSLQGGAFEMKDCKFRIITVGGAKLSIGSSAGAQVESAGGTLELLGGTEAKIVKVLNGDIVSDGRCKGTNVKSLILSKAKAKDAAMKDANFGSIYVEAGSTVGRVEINSAETVTVEDMCNIKRSDFTVHGRLGTVKNEGPNTLVVYGSPSHTEGEVEVR